MIPANGGGALALAEPSKGIVAPTQAMMGGGGGFSETWAINGDQHAFLNKKTQEVRKDLYIIVEEMHPARALFPKSGPQKGELVCASDDAKSSRLGIACGSCPHVMQVDEFNKYYEAHTDIQRPGSFIGDCSLRYAIYWTKEFIVNPDNTLTLNVHEKRVLVNVPYSSILALWSATGYLPKLKQQGLDVLQVVTRLLVKQRPMKDTGKMYDYADFENVGTVESVMAKVARTVAIAADAAGAPAQNVGGRVLPTMAGQPASAPATSGFPAAPGFQPTAAPAAAAPSFPAAAPAAAAPGFPPQAAPGFPPAAAPAAAAPAAPGFPGVSAPATQAPAAPAAPAPSFQDMARAKLLSDFAALAENVKPIVLNVLGVADINTITNDKVIMASQAVASAKGYSATPATAAKNPF
jgi:hypothetical protein